MRRGREMEGEGPEAGGNPRNGHDEEVEGERKRNGEQKGDDLEEEARLMRWRSSVRGLDEQSCRRASRR